MREKYKVEIYENDELVKTKTFKTKPEIIAEYNISLQLIDKIIKINNHNFEFKHKNPQYKKLYDKFKIYIIEII